MDHISNLLTHLRNAQLASLRTASVRATKVNLALLEVLRQNKYIASFTTNSDGRTADVTLRTEGATHFRRISKPSRRVYTTAKNIPTVRQGLGMVILSTPEGVIPGPEARKRHLGGEILCEVY